MSHRNRRRIIVLQFPREADLAGPMTTEIDELHNSGQPNLQDFKTPPIAGLSPAARKSPGCMTMRGGRRSPLRTSLRTQFPSKREINWEFCKIRPSCNIFDGQQASEFKGLQPNSLRIGSGNFSRHITEKFRDIGNSRLKTDGVRARVRPASRSLATALCRRARCAACWRWRSRPVVPKLMVSQLGSPCASSTASCGYGKSRRSGADNGHQTQVITSRCDLRDIEVAYRMFERWRQENFFKYMREEFLLDALVDYRIEPEDPTRTIPNPARRALDKEIRAARADLARLEREYGAAAADNAEQHRPTMRGFKIAHGRLGKQLRTARARVERLFKQRCDVAKRVEIRDLNERAVVKLATERKHLTDIIKMVAYQAESDLVALLRPHYARVDQEGRTLLHELFAAAGDIRVSDSELHITLAPLSSPHRTHAAQALCGMLDQTATIFPGSRLRIRFQVRPPPRIGLAFPGSPVERSSATAVAPAP